MINTAETKLPTNNSERINTSETRLPNSVSNSGVDSVFAPGESVADSYYVNSLLDKQGRQATVYSAKKWGKNYIIKLYSNEWKPSKAVQNFLLNVRHPNIAHVIDSGEHNGDYYEIYDYYSEGTLEDVKTVSGSVIANVIVPSINEGLHELHDKGIVHCDIKPSNLFFSDERRSVIIGDCGISGYSGTDGRFVGAVRGTPEYAPPVKSVMGSAVITPAYDYGSFGLVLCRMAMGRSLFEGMSETEIATAWCNGLVIPNPISGRLSMLVKGLLNPDENKRWGYLDVKRWCEGEYRTAEKRDIFPKRTDVAEKKPLVFGKIDNKMLSVKTLHQLAVAIVEHWEQATNIIRRNELVSFIRQFDSDMSEKARKCALIKDNDIATYKLLTIIEKNPTRICFCGKVYNSFLEYVNQLATGKDEVAMKFLSSGMLVYFLRENNFEPLQVDKLEQIILREGSKNMSAALTVCYTLRGNKTIEIRGVQVQTLEDLYPILMSSSVREINDMLLRDDFIAWMNRMGYEKEMRRIREVC